MPTARTPRAVSKHVNTTTKRRRLTLAQSEVLHEGARVDKIVVALFCIHQANLHTHTQKQDEVQDGGGGGGGAYIHGTQMCH